MKQKKLVYYFLILAISLSLSLPLLNLFFTYKNAKINLESFSKEQLFSTDYLESIENYLVYKIFNISLNEGQVIAGKDNFLFLGNSFGGILDKTQGTFSYSNKGIDVWTSKLKKLQSWYESQGIEFVIVIASNKHTIYSNKLPDKIVYKEDRTITDDIVRYSLNKGIHILNLKKVLREKAKDNNNELFFHTDTHWNNYGAYIGYINTIKYLNNTYKKSYRIGESTMQKTTSHYVGDLSNFLKINHLLSKNYETNYSFTFKNKSQICDGKITTTIDNKLQKCSTTKKNTFNNYTINEAAPNKEKLLYICDSFGVANLPFYQEMFNTVWRFHVGYTLGAIGGIGLLSNFIQKYKPDIVIYQIVERDLGNNSIIRNMPQKTDPSN